MLSGVARVHHHDGFKAAWEECDRLTVLKHLDNDAPSLHVRQPQRPLSHAPVAPFGHQPAPTAGPVMPLPS